MAARVVLAMSGGVDSSVAAYLLRQQGYEVIGLFMRTGAHGNDDDGRADRKKGCCSAIDAGDARRVADRLDIPFYALDFEREFDRVIEYFADEYLSGRTPNPCVVCNSWLKFGKLWSYGKQLGADFIATGHYARIVRRDGGAGPATESRATIVARRSATGSAELHRAADPEKDQSYVLYGIRRSVLPRLLFPVGDCRKEEVREIARAAGLGVADKPDSVEICFVPDGDHAALVRGRRPAASTAGRVVDTSGRVLADHEGIEHFTVGQRRGLGFAAGQRRYVLQIVPATNEIVIGDREDLLSAELWAASVNWLCDPPTGRLRCSAKIRYRHRAASATVTALPGDGAQLVFDEPQPAVAPGQAVVLYDGARVLGGGWIEGARSRADVATA